MYRKNTGRIGVLLMGDFEPGDVIKWPNEKPLVVITIGPQLDQYGSPTEKQMKSAYSLVRYLDAKYGIESVVGHRNVPGNQTVCPGRFALSLVTALNNLVKGR